MYCNFATFGCLYYFPHRVVQLFHLVFRVKLGFDPTSKDHGLDCESSTFTTRPGQGASLSNLIFKNIYNKFDIFQSWDYHPPYNFSPPIYVLGVCGLNWQAKLLTDTNLDKQIHWNFTHWFIFISEVPCDFV